MFVKYICIDFFSIQNDRGGIYDYSPFDVLFSERFSFLLALVPRISIVPYDWDGNYSKGLMAISVRFRQ